MRPHERLNVWKRAIDLTVLVYELTRGFPKSERYGLVSQARRAAISVAANIAEGAARSTSPDKLRFFYIARGSLSELDTHMEISQRLGFVTPNQYNASQLISDEVSRMLQGLIDCRSPSVT